MTYISNPVTCLGKLFISSREVKDAVFRFGQFINCDFSNLDLFSVDLSNCIFDSCSFQKTRFGNCQNSKFYTCNLTGADATDANLSKCLAMNCQAEGLKMTGAIISVDCNFFSGLITDRTADSASLLYWVTQLENGYAKDIRKHLLETVPPHIKAFLEVAFQRDPTD